MALAETAAIHPFANSTAQTNEIGSALKSLRMHFLTAGIFSGIINLLYLSSPIYLMQVYNRVLLSENISTLVMLTIILASALAVMG